MDNYEGQFKTFQNYIISETQQIFVHKSIYRDKTMTECT